MSISVWLITGASSGLGYALAEHVLKQGDQVVLAARTVASMEALAASYPNTALAVGLDVSDPQQQVAALRQAEARFGAIDFLVNNAGIDFLGAIEEQDEADYRKIFEVNFFGAVALLRLALPAMRARGRGMIVNMSSMDGIASLPANGFYSASKFALEGMTEALWQEIEPLGLRAMLIEPGSFRTGIGGRTKFSGQKDRRLRRYLRRLPRGDGQRRRPYVPGRPSPRGQRHLHDAQIGLQGAPAHPWRRRLSEHRGEDQRPARRL